MGGEKTKGKGEAARAPAALALAALLLLAAAGAGAQEAPEAAGAVAEAVEGAEGAVEAEAVGEGAEAVGAAAAAPESLDGLAVTGTIQTALVVEKKAELDDARVYLLAEEAPGRAQFNFALTKGAFKANWSLRLAGYSTLSVPYAYGVADILGGKARVTVGLIDGVVWGSGGATDVSFDGGGIARFEFKPLEGLNLGFWLPKVAVYAEDGDWTWSLQTEDYWNTSTNKAAEQTEPTKAPGEDNSTFAKGEAASPAGTSVTRWVASRTAGVPGFTAGQYFSELGFGLSYALAKTVDLRLGLQLDGDGDQILTGDLAGKEEGINFLWGLHPTIVTSLVPGLTVNVDGKITGLGQDDAVGTVTALKVAYAQTGGLSASLPFKLETIAKRSQKADSVPELVFDISPGVSYAVTPWFTPGLDLGLNIVSGSGLGAFNSVSITPYVTLLAGNLTIKPSFNATIKGEKSRAAYGYVEAKGNKFPKGDAATDLKFTLLFSYGF